MALKFEIKKGKAEFKEEYLIHREFADLYELDQSEDKDFAQRLFTVVYMIGDEESSLRNMVESVKWEYAINNCQITTEELSLARPCLEEAIGLYSYLNNTAEYRSIQSLERVLNSLNDQLAEITPSAINVKKKINVGTKNDPQYEEIEEIKDNYNDIQRLTDLIEDTRSKLSKMKEEYNKNKLAGTLRADKEPGGLATRKLTNPALNQNFKR
jgi:hypothetical protein